jgi:hypothetical protein
MYRVLRANKVRTAVTQRYIEDEKDRRHFKALINLSVCKKFHGLIQMLI